MFVSRKTLSLIRLFTIERETGGERPARPPQSLEGLLSGSIATHFELPGTGDPDLDVVPFSQLQRLHDGGWKTDREAVAPLRDLHDDLRNDIHLYCISSRLGRFRLGPSALAARRGRRLLLLPRERLGDCICSARRAPDVLGDSL